jgi:hypothetical protein
MAVTMATCVKPSLTLSSRNTVMKSKINRPFSSIPKFFVSFPIFPSRLIQTIFLSQLFDFFSLQCAKKLHFSIKEGKIAFNMKINASYSEFSPDNNAKSVEESTSEPNEELLSWERTTESLTLSSTFTGLFLMTPQVHLSNKYVVGKSLFHIFFIFNLKNCVYVTFEY